jgi:hypothetical protein
MLWRMLSRLETSIVYSCIWSVNLAKSIVPGKRENWQFVDLSRLQFTSDESEFIAKSENAMLWRMLSRLETSIVYSCIWSVTLAKGSYPHKFLCRTNCSACADYQPCLLMKIYPDFSEITQIKMCLCIASVFDDHRSC